MPFGRGHGVATVRVSHEKDREGFVHAIGVDDGQPDGLLVGAENGTTTVELPSKEIAAAVADKRSSARRAVVQCATWPTRWRSSVGGSRPTRSCRRTRPSKRCWRAKAAGGSMSVRSPTR